MTKAILTVFAVAALAMTVNGAFANSNLNSSRSNVYKATTISGSKSSSSQFKACVDGGGSVKKDAKGNQDCTPKK